MKKRSFSMFIALALLLLTFFSGCSKKEPISSPTDTNTYKKVEHIGQIPDELKNITDNNLFCDVTFSDGKILTSEKLTTDEEPLTVTHRIRMTDIYGKELAEYSCTSEDAYFATTLTATEDSGFLFVLGFQDYTYGDNKWASEKGFASRIVKCDINGKLQFDTPLDNVEGNALKYCFEKNGQFYFFGDIETPETKNTGVHSPTDISLIIIDKNGKLIKKQYIAGSDYDSLENAEICDGGFLLSLSSQSDDGDFSGSASGGYPVDWVIEINDSLEITDKKKENGREYMDNIIGEKDDTPIYKSDSLFKNFDAGSPNLFIDYGDYYLIVSDNITGIYENTPPFVSAIWHYTETVYSAYDNNGKLIFRTSVDSSPDYDSMAKQLLQQ